MSQPEKPPTAIPTIPKPNADGSINQTKYADASSGRFHRPQSAFRSWIGKPTSDTDATIDYPAEKGRYVLYLNYGCPWAHRTNIVRSLKGLDDIIERVVLGIRLGKEGWEFTPNLHQSLDKDPLYGFTNLKQLYLHANPEYTGRYTVPVLYDKKTESIVNNESSEIIRMMYTAFDELIPDHLREANKPHGGLLPANLKDEIDEFNEWVYSLINNGVYKTGFAATQQAYEEAIYPLFEALDRVETHLKDQKHGGPYLFGEQITDADVRLYVTIVRFDAAYYTIFRTNLKMIRHDYPRIDKWLRKLYWDESERTNGGAFKNTTDFEIFKQGYAKTRNLLVPAGPLPNILPAEA